MNNINSTKLHKADFNKIYYYGKFIATRYVKLNFIFNNKDHMRVAFAIKRNQANSVERNKIRRRLKMATRKAIVELSSSFNKKYKYAIFAKAKVYDENFQNLVEELKSKFKEAN